MSEKSKWWLSLAAKYLAVLVGIVVYTVIVCGLQYAKDERVFNEKFEAYKAEQIALAEADAAMPMSFQETLNSEAEELARVLYGVKDNSTDDLRTYCWCVFNRVDNAKYPDTLEDVIAQPNQWMRYSPENPVLESLYQIAYDELYSWTTGSRRPVSSEYVFMNWSPSDLVLRDNFKETNSTHYWRYK